MTRQLSRAIVYAGACIGAGLALSRLPGDDVLLVVRALACAGVTVVCAYGIHRIKSWAAERPILPAPSQLYAVSQEYGPQIAGEMARAQAAERKAEHDDVDRQWNNAIIRFVVLGSMKKSFGWDRMKSHVDRPGWDLLKDTLEGCGVLRIGHGRTPTGFAEGWYCRRVWVGLQSGEIDPPLPTGGMIPEVRW